MRGAKGRRPGIPVGVVRVEGDGLHQSGPEITKNIAAIGLESLENHGEISNELNLDIRDLHTSNWLSHSCHNRPG